jgi:hypothetical protein
MWSLAWQNELLSYIIKALQVILNSTTAVYRKNRQPSKQARSGTYFCLGRLEKSSGTDVRKSNCVGLTVHELLSRMACKVSLDDAMATKGISVLSRALCPRIETFLQPECFKEFENSVLNCYKQLTREETTRSFTIKGTLTQTTTVAIVGM